MASPLKSAYRGVKRQLAYYRLVFKHPRTPRRAKLLLGLAVLYLALPFDLIPDFIPVVGHLDDVIVVPGLIFLAMKPVPSNVAQECRALVANT